jgi:hypothetical protein
VSRRESQLRPWGRVVLLLAALACLLAPGEAAGLPRDVYALDISRPTFPIGVTDPAPGRIIQVDPTTGAEIREIVPHGLGVEPLHAPTGIAVDADGYLIVADTDGYNASYAFPAGGTDLCSNTGCGAVLRVNPGDGSAQVLSRGPYAGNPSAVLLPPDGDINNDGGGIGDQLLVVDTANRMILGVDPYAPPDTNQSVVYENYSAVNPMVSPDATPGNRKGLRNPWDIARDPDTGDLLITNVGVRGTQSEPLESIAGCDDDGDPSNGFAESDGYIARFDPSLGFTDKRGITDYVCDPDFRKPRGIVVANGERMFVTDPFATSGSDFAALFSIVGRDVQMLSLGGLMRTPSGLSFTYEGDELLVADESSFPPPIRDCVGSGCGGVLALDPISGEQAPFSPHAMPSFLYRDPIDVAVDRAGAPTPLGQKPGECGKKQGCCPKRKPRCKRTLDFIHFFNIGSGTRKALGVSGEPRGIEVLLMESLGEVAKVRFLCLSPSCPVKTQTQRATDGRVAFDFGSDPLQGSFRITAYVPLEDKRRNLKVVYLGRYQDFSFVPGPGAEIARGDRGCLRPGESKVRKRKPRTTTKCPVVDGH